MKKNSGSAITSVIVVFLLVIMIGAPLLGMVVQNYQLREYDSGIKEAEYKNEIIMDRISTVIRNAVITAINDAKTSSTSEISAVTDTLINSYNKVYDNAVDSVPVVNPDGTEVDQADYIADLKSEITSSLKGSLPNEISGVENDDLINLLTINDDDLSAVQINEEALNSLCNEIFQQRYKDSLTGKLEEDNIFEKIYTIDYEGEFGINRDNLSYGDQKLANNNGRTKPLSLRIKSAYNWNWTDKTFNNTYENPASLSENEASFDDELRIGVESEYKHNERTPVTKLSATYIIKLPNFSEVSAVEQQTISYSNPLSDYALVVGETLELENEVHLSVDGNIVTKANGVTEDNFNGISMEIGSSLLAEDINGSISEGRIATAGDIIMDTNTSLKTGSNPIYYRNLYVGKPDEKKNTGSINVEFNGDVLAKDDLEVNLDSEVNITQVAGSYYGFNDVNGEGPDSSSAIVINSTASALSSIKLTLRDLYLAGRAFIDGIESAEPDSDGNHRIYKTGESLSVKGNYVAYQTPFFSDDTEYKYNKVKFSTYFMKGKKSNIVDGSNESIEKGIPINLVDRFLDTSGSEDGFDVNHKWQYFKKYAEENSISSPIVQFEADAVIESQGVVLKNSEEVTGGQSITPKTSAILANKADRFEEFTQYFGHVPKIESNRKSKITDWIKIGSETKKAATGNFFTYISKSNSPQKIILKSDEKAGISQNGNNIQVSLAIEDSNKEMKGIIIHDGDLTIENNCGADIPFKGIIIVTGNLTINKNIKIISDKDFIAESVVNNYLGTSYIDETTNEVIGEGDLFNVFAYDGSGTNYVAINVSDKSNIININELVGITNWEKTDYGRL